jgi:hypothetical protein
MHSRRCDSVRPRRNRSFSPELSHSSYRRRAPENRPPSGGRRWWAHFELTRINITPTIPRKKIKELMKVPIISGGRDQYC